MPEDRTDSTGDSPADAVTGPVNDALTGRGTTTGALDDTLTGQLLDRSHTTAPYDMAAVIAEEATAAGARDVAFWIHDYDQRLLHPLAVGRPPEQTGAVESMDTSLPGRAFALHTFVEQEQSSGWTRVWMPLLDGTERVGTMALTVEHLDDELRAYLRRLAGHVAHLFLSKNLYTDDYQRVRRRRDMSLAAEMQWELLPPLAISTPAVTVAGLLEPAYQVAGDSFDYALNDEGLHFAIFDAMGHGLASAIMASTAVAAYRNARRSRMGLAATYGAVDEVLSGQFGEDTFCTAQFATLDVDTGTFCWVNAGHPAPLLVRDGKAVRFLGYEPTLPVGFGGPEPAVASEDLRPGDRLLFFTDGVIEHRNAAGEMFGEDRLAAWLLRHLSDELPSAEVLRRLNRDLLEAIGPEGPKDDATLVLVHWTGPQASVSELPAAAV